MRRRRMDVLEPSSTSAEAPSRYTRAFVGAVIVSGSAVLGHAAWDLLSQPPSFLLLILLLLTITSSFAILGIPGMPIRFSISDTFTIIAALTIGPAAGALNAAVDGVVLTCLMTNDRSWRRVLFNAASPAIATWVAAQVFVALAGPQPLLPGPFGALRLLALLAVFGAVDFALSSATVAIAIALERRLPVLSVLKEHFGGFWLTYLGGIFAATLMMAMDRASALETLILIAPLPVILYVTYRHAEARAREQVQHLAKMNTVYVAAIEALAQAIDTKDQVTHDHIRRVQESSIRLARSLGVADPLELEAIKAASLLHDVGKIGVPEHILNKPGRLTPSEFEIMKRHAPMGADILSVIDFPYPVVPIVRHHHENWDGSGYPDGIAGEAIPIGARILQIVDCFDALTSDRPYRPRLSNQDALQILIDRKGTMYDPRIVDEFLELHGADAGEQPALTSPGAGDGRPADVAKDAPPVEELGLQAFFALGRALGPDASAFEAGRVIWAHLRPLLPAGAFVLYVHDEESHALVPGFCSDAALAAAPMRVPLGERVSGWVAATGRSMVNADARLDLEPEGYAHGALKSALAVPTRGGARQCAVLAFYAYEADAFTDGHRQIAEAASSALAATGIAGQASLVTAA